MEAERQCWARTRHSCTPNLLIVRVGPSGLPLGDKASPIHNYCHSETRSTLTAQLRWGLGVLLLFHSCLCFFYASTLISLCAHETGIESRTKPVPGLCGYLADISGQETRAVSFKKVRRAFYMSAY